jgi:hypothetical protein
MNNHHPLSVAFGAKGERRAHFKNSYGQRQAQFYFFRWRSM